MCTYSKLLSFVTVVSQLDFSHKSNHHIAWSLNSKFAYILISYVKESQGIAHLNIIISF